jgi:glycosyltransferase involved in cell wall biosynthesis
MDGLLVPVEDAEALARALRRVMDDAGLRGQLSAAALAVRERYAKEAILQRWEFLIEEVRRG